MKTLDILAIGEPLMEFAEVERGGERLYLPGFGGDTSNAAGRGGAAGRKAGYLHGPRRRCVRARLPRRCGTGRASTAPPCSSRQDAPTGIYFITYGPDGHEFSYSRAGSAASLRATGRNAAATGSPRRACCTSRASARRSRQSCADAAFAAIAMRARAGTTVSYDTNLRLRLWPLDRARAVIHAALA